VVGNGTVRYVIGKFLTVVSMPQSAAVWPQFATHVFGSDVESLRYIGSYVRKYEPTFIFAGFHAQAVRSVPL